jgi:hypothetical protein
MLLESNQPLKQGFITNNNNNNNNIMNFSKLVVQRWKEAYGHRASDMTTKINQSFSAQQKV